MDSKTQRAVERLLALPVVEQRTAAWLAARDNVITASEVASCFKLTSDVIKPYVEYFRLTDFPARPKASASGNTSADALVKRKLGLSPAFTGNKYTEFGTMYEPVAGTIYQQMAGTRLHEFGLVPHPTLEFLGASPDGCGHHGRLVEIKCPSTRIPDGRVPFPYWCQMQLQLECCDLEYCDFFDARFVEYVDEEAWLDGASKSQEKQHHTHGFILLDDQTPIYAGPTVRTLNEFEEWERGVTASLGRKLRRVLYSLWHHEMIRVRRDRDWMAARIPQIEAVWQQVLQGRREAQGRQVNPGKDVVRDDTSEEKPKTKGYLTHPHCLV